MELRFDSCVNCFARLDGKTVCPNCGMDKTKIKEYSEALPPFTLLNNQYLTGRVLGKGGFGITYLAQNIETGKLCCIKEYLPSEYAKREQGGILQPKEVAGRGVYQHGKKRFIDEARTLVKLQNNNIVVDIWDFFEENNTAYFVMEYLNGVSMKRLTATYGGKLPKEIADKILEVIGIALADVHEKGLLHRDISPENIFITRDKEIKLIDFGAARDYVMSQNKGMSVVLKAGYAPPEQYSSKGAQGPWTDIYALAATYYTCVSGEKLLDSMFILKGMKQPPLVELNCGVEQRKSDVIAKAMAINYKERYQNVVDFLTDLQKDMRDRNNVLQMNIHEVQSDYSANAGIRKTAYTQSVSGYVQSQNITGVQKNKQAIGSPIIEVLGDYRRKINVPDNYTIKVGRSNRECDLVVNKDTIISRVHLLIAYERDLGKFVVTDKSSNGVFLDGGIRLQKDKSTLIDAGTVMYLADMANAIKVSLQ